MANNIVEIFKNFNGCNCINEDELSVKFRDIAQKLICEGYLLVNKSTRIYLTDIEFYYHEEGDATTINNRDKIKDPAMYHTYERENNEEANKMTKESTLLPYFPVGSFHSHVSGIDITFENEAARYRASVLIRGFRVRENGKAEEIVEKRPTYLYDYLIDGYALPLIVEWIADKSEGFKLRGENLVRKNVAEYKKIQPGIYEKKPGDSASEKTFQYNGKPYVQCMRPWRFQRAE